jgi:hypothetical protein
MSMSQVTTNLGTIAVKALRKPYGCVVEISKGDFNWKEVLPYSDESRKIEELIKVAQTLEAKDKARAISMYREAIVQIIAFDEAGSSIKAARRRVQYPVNRLSLLLETCGELQSA